MALAPTKAKTSTQGKDPNDDGKDSVSRKEFDELAGLLKQTIQGVGQINQVVAGLSESVSKGFTNLQNVTPSAPPAPREPEPVDLEALNNKDLANFIIKSVSNVLDDKIKENLTPLTDQIKTTQQNATASDLRTQWNELTTKNKDAVYLANEIKQQAAANPNLSLKDLYTLAKANNPEKVQQVTEQLKQEEEKAQQLEKQTQQGEGKKTRYGGMPPQGSPDLADDFKTDLPPNEAAEAAWAELGLDENLATNL